MKFKLEPFLQSKQKKNNFSTYLNKMRAKVVCTLRRQLSNKFVFAFTFLTIFTNFAVFSPYPLPYVGLLFLFLPGFGILLIFSEFFHGNNVLENAILAGALSVTVFPFFVMLLMLTFGYFPLKIGSLVLLDLILVFVIFFKKNENNVDKTPNKYLGKPWKFSIIPLAISLIFFDALYNFKTLFQTIPNSVFIHWDNVLFFRLIQGFRFGAYPPPALAYLPAGVEGGASLFFISPTFLFHANLLELTNMDIIPYALIISSFLHLLVICALFLVARDIFKDYRAAFLAAFWFSFSSDLMGLLFYLPQLIMPSPSLPVYRGVYRPVLFEGNFFNYPITTSPIDLASRGIYVDSAYLIIILILYLLSHNGTNKSIKFIALLVFLINPIQAITHLGIIGIFFIGLFAALFAKLLVRERLIERLIPRKFRGLNGPLLTILFCTLLIFGFALIFSLKVPSVWGHIQFRNAPVSSNFVSIVEYFGFALPFSLIGLIFIFKQKYANFPLLVIGTHAIIGFFLASFVDLNFSGFIDNAPIHFSWYFSMIMLAGFGFAKIVRYFDNVRIKTNTTRWGKFHFKRMKPPFIFTVLFVIVFSSFATTMMFYNTDLASISTEYYGEVFAYTSSESDAYSWTQDQTSKNSIFLVSPSHWWFPSIAGRQVVYVRNYNLDGTPDELETEKRIDVIYKHLDPEIYVPIIQEYQIDFIYVGPPEYDRYGYNLLNKFLQNSYFVPVFSNSQVTIFATPKGIEKMYAPRLEGLIFPQFSNERIFTSNDTDFWDVSLNSEGGSIAYDEENGFWIRMTNSSNLQIYHQFIETQNFSKFEHIEIIYHGSGSGKKIEFVILAPDWDNCYLYWFSDDLDGWQLISFSLLKLKPSMGNPILDCVTEIRLHWCWDVQYTQSNSVKQIFAVMR
jgi:hypothetical protein